MELYSSSASENLDDAKAAEIVYSEKLYPSLGIWVINVVFSLTMLLIFVPINLTMGVTAMVTVFLLAAVFWITATPRIKVTEEVLYAGKAVINRRHLGRAEGFRKQSAVEERGIRLHGGAYLLIRGWIDPVAKIEIVDAGDPHPYWLISTRNPERLVRILNS